MKTNTQIEKAVSKHLLRFVLEECDGAWDYANIASENRGSFVWPGLQFECRRFQFLLCYSNHLTLHTNMPNKLFSAEKLVSPKAQHRNFP